jgi:hypothetical protein
LGHGLTWRRTRFTLGSSCCDKRFTAHVCADGGCGTCAFPAARH